MRPVNIQKYRQKYRQRYRRKSTNRKLQTGKYRQRKLDQVMDRGWDSEGRTVTVADCVKPMFFLIIRWMCLILTYRNILFLKWQYLRYDGKFFSLKYRCNLDYLQCQFWLMIFLVIFVREWPNMLTPCYSYVTLIMIRINIVEHILKIRLIFFIWYKRVSNSEYKAQISSY